MTPTNLNMLADWLEHVTNKDQSSAEAWAKSLRSLARDLEECILIDPDRLMTAERELERIEDVLNRSETGIRRKNRDLHDWLAQIMQVAVCSGAFEPKRKKAKRG